MSLPIFEDQPVARAAVKIMKAGDGLSEALRIEPRPMHLGENAYFVLRGICTGITHVEKDEVVTRVHTITTEHIVEVSSTDVDNLLEQAADRLARARESAEGQGRLDDD